MAWSVPSFLMADSTSALSPPRTPALSTIFVTGSSVTGGLSPGRAGGNREQPGQADHGEDTFEL